MSMDGKTQHLLNLNKNLNIPWIWVVAILNVLWILIVKKLNVPQGGKLAIFGRAFQNYKRAQTDVDKSPYQSGKSGWNISKHHEILSSNLEILFWWILFQKKLTENNNMSTVTGYIWSKKRICLQTTFEGPRIFWKQWRDLQHVEGLHQLYPLVRDPPLSINISDNILKIETFCFHISIVL